MLTRWRKWCWALEVAISPVYTADRPDLIELLDELSTKTSDFAYQLDIESGQIILGAHDETQLEGSVDLIRTAGRCEINLGAPQVSYRETILNVKEADHAHRTQSRDASEFARVRLRVEPLGKGGGIEFENESREGALPKAYVDAIKKGIERGLDAGAVVGFPVIDLRITLIDTSSVEPDSNCHAFETAARAALSEALKGASPVLLEPIMQVEIITPEDFMGDVIGDLSNRRGGIQGAESLDGSAAITALVPLARMFGYSNILAGMTANRASYASQLSHYDRVPMQSGDDPPGTEPAAVALRA